MLKNGKTQLMLGSPYYHPEPKKTDGKYPQAVYYFHPEDAVALRESLVRKGFEDAPQYVFPLETSYQKDTLKCEHRAAFLRHHVKKVTIESLPAADVA
jgi:hypothetical protein